MEYDKDNKKENGENYVDIENDKDISKIIRIKHISAKRLVDNKDSNKTLSMQSASYYEKIENTPEMEQNIADFRNELEKTDKKFDEKYAQIFKDVIDKPWNKVAFRAK